MFPWISISCLNCLSRSLSYMIALPVVVFSRPWTPHTAVLKNAACFKWMSYGILEVKCQVNENDSETSSSLLKRWFKYLTAPIVSFALAKIQNWLVGRVDFVSWVKLYLFRKFLLKAHYYPAYFIMTDWPDWTVSSNGEFSMQKLFMMLLIFVVEGKRVFRSSWILNECNLSCKIGLLWDLKSPKVAHSRLKSPKVAFSRLKSL